MHEDPPWSAPLRDDLSAAPRGPIAQVGTVGVDGAPQVRSVVVRGVDGEGAPWFASDARGAKFRGGDEMELCLWLASAGVQWRLRGPFVVLGPEAPDGWGRERRRLWRRADPEVRRRAVGVPPGTPLPRGENGAPPVPEADPPAAFVVVRVPPTRVERLSLVVPHERVAWRRDRDGWSGRPLAP